MIIVWDEPDVSPTKPTRKGATNGQKVHLGNETYMGHLGHFSIAPICFKEDSKGAVDITTRNFTSANGIVRAMERTA